MHGTPTWSFLWRQQVKELSKQYWCIALDHLGFGLSDKPKAFSYALEAHRQNLQLLTEHLQLEEITLIVHDFGGPIGLGWAVENPDKVKAVVILNSWMWPLTEVKPMRQASKFFSSWLGKFLYLNLNFLPKVLLPQAFHHKSKLTKEVHQHYLKPFNKKSVKWGTWYFAKALSGETAYFEKLYSKRQALENKLMHVIWGKQDKLIPASFLEKWQKIFPFAVVTEVQTGHFLQEEAPDEVTKAIQELLTNTIIAKSSTTTT